MDMRERRGLNRRDFLKQTTVATGIGAFAMPAPAAAGERVAQPFRASM
jgi:hypothetical protein